MSQHPSFARAASLALPRAQVGTPFDGGVCDDGRPPPKPVALAEAGRVLRRVLLVEGTVVELISNGRRVCAGEEGTCLKRPGVATVVLLAVNGGRVALRMLEPRYERQRGL